MCSVLEIHNDCNAYMNSV